MSMHVKRLVAAAALAFGLGFCFVCTAGQNIHPFGGHHFYSTGELSAAGELQMDQAAQIEFSKQDLASRLDLEPGQIEVMAFRQVTWRSGALGCARPGMSYADALVPGILLLLRVDEAVYRYHAIPGGQPFYCPNKWAESPLQNLAVD